MKKLLYYIKFGILGMIVWCILYEGISIAILLSGFGLGIFSAMFSNIFLSTEKLTSAYRLNFLMFFLFLVVLVYRIYIAGISAIPHIIKGKNKIGIIDIETEVPDGMPATVLANSITLTPGTVTIEKKGQKLKVLWLNKTTDDPVEAAAIINGPLERILNRATKHD